MRAIPQSVTRWLRFGLAVLLCCAALLPTVVRADTDLDVGGLAHVAYAGGDPVRLRTGPGYNNDTVKLVSEGTTLDVLQGPLDADDGSVWYKVNAGGDTGYIVSDYLASGAGDTSGSASGDAATPAAASASASDSTGATSNTTTTMAADALNLRAGPSSDASVLLVIPAGAALTVTGDAQSDFTPVSYNGQDGWVASAYLGDSPSSQSDNGAVAGAGSAPSGGGSLIVWPMASGGVWHITQGYNGPIDHQNWDSTWQYYYSFDLMRVDGETANAPVYSPVNGTIRWIDYGYGGMSIDMGDGYAFAYFHTYLADGLAAGQHVSQGQYLGSIAAAGDAGTGSAAHLHISLWQTSDGGNWDRHAVPFTGQFAISGDDFPDIGGADQYSGTLVYP